jgi:2-haloacid dehalogenase
MLRRMTRRDFLRTFAGSLTCGLVAACAPRTATLASPTAGSRIRAVCFDLFTLFDPRSVVRVAAAVVPEQATELCAEWRTRQFEYSWLRGAARQYASFDVVTEEALVYAARARGITLSETDRRTLVSAYSTLDPWPDTRSSLERWKRDGLRLAPLSNYTPPMLEALMARAGLTDLFDELISTHPARAFKPSPEAYALGPSTLGLPRAEIAFAAFGGWDAAGAKWFGFPTFWVNRLGVPGEALSPPPDATGPTFGELAEFIASVR